MPIIAVTGHRNLSDKQIKRIKNITGKIVRKYGYDNVEFICGGARGTDTIAARFCQENMIVYSLYFPFPYHNKDNNELKQTAKKTVELYEDYFANWQFQERNKAMVNDCDILLAFYDGREKGGTYNCIKYAKSKLVPIIFIDMKI